jgi:Tfp pilus assembly protein PilF
MLSSINIRRLMAEGRYAEAEELLRASLEAGEQNATTYANLSICLSKQHHSSEAESLARHSLSLDPKTALAHYSLALALIESQKYLTGRQSLHQAIRLHPQNPLFYLTLALTYRDEQRWADGLQAVMQGLAINANHKELNELHSLFLHHLNQPGGGNDLLLKVNQGWTFLQQGQIVPAIDSFQASLRLDPQHDRAKQGLHEALQAFDPLYGLVLNILLAVNRHHLMIYRLLFAVGWIFIQALAEAARQIPPLLYLLVPLVLLYIGLAIILWASRVMIDLWLSWHEVGLASLPVNRRRGVNAVSLCLLGVVTFGLLGLILSNNTGELLMLGAAQMLLMILAIYEAFVFMGDSRSQQILRAYTLLMGLLIALGFVMGALYGDRYAGLALLAFLLLFFIRPGLVKFVLRPRLG